MYNPPSPIPVSIVTGFLGAGKSTLLNRLLKDPALGPVIAADLEKWLTEEMGWHSLGIAPSPIEGGEGNREFLLAGRKPGKEEE